MAFSAIGKRVKQNAETTALYAGGSNHGFKWGHIQADAAAALSTSQIGLQALIRTNTIVGLYILLDTLLGLTIRKKRPHALMIQA